MNRRKLAFRKYPLNNIDCTRSLVYRTCFCHPSVVMNTRIFQTHTYPITESEDYAFGYHFLKPTNFTMFRSLYITGVVT